MATIETKVETQTYEDSEGNVTSTTKETTKKIERSTEPDYIKIYTNMWCEFNQIPHKWRDLFLQLAIRMTYSNLPKDKCNSDGLFSGPGGQLVSTGKPYGDDICMALGWKVSDKTNNQLMQGLRELCKCNAIRKINRGVYQINPQYAGKGEWKYNPKADRGGVEALTALFNFSEKDVSTNVIWADDGTDTELNQTYREGLEVDSKDNTVLMTTRIKNIDNKPVYADLEEVSNG